MRLIESAGGLGPTRDERAAYAWTTFSRSTLHVLLRASGPLRPAHEELAPLVPHALAEALGCVPDEWLLGEPGFEGPDEVRAAYSEVLLARLDQPEVWLNPVEVARVADL